MHTGPEVVNKKMSRAKISVKQFLKIAFLQLSVFGVMTHMAENTFSPLYISVCGT